jgi:acetyl esterase/lipase
MISKLSWQTVSVSATWLAAIFAISTSGAQEITDVSDRPSITLRPDIPYASIDGHDLMLDLYLPAGVANPPLLVWVHGGAWRAGSRKNVNAVDLVEAGYAIASVSYRLSTVAPFPAQVHDIKGAIRYLRAHADELGYDASEIGIMGASAGAHLAALVGVTNGSAAHEGTVGGNETASSDVQAVVSYFGASNLLSILAQSTPFGINVRVPALELLLGGPVESKHKLARLASPVFFVDGSDPPMYLLHGDQDPQMPINQTHELDGALQSSGVDVTFEVVHGAGHGGAAFFDTARTKHVAAFLDRQLKH